MLGEKWLILAHLKMLRESTPARRWSLSGLALASAAGMATAIAVVPGGDERSIKTETVVQALGTPAIQIEQTDPRPFIREDRIRPGESLAGALRRLGVSNTLLSSQINALAASNQLKGITAPGTLITVATSAEGSLHSASLHRPGSEIIHTLESTDGKLRITPQTASLDVRTHMQGGVVQSSLFAAMDNAGLPDSIAEELSRIFGDDIDFHTDVRRGDRFNVIYEVLYHQGRAVKTGRILAAEFINQGQRHSAFLFTHPNGDTDYYNTDGRSHKAGFLRSPLEFSRVSSGFSMRLHPVFGTWREHKGVDYAAPHGTAVKATSDGTVEFVGRQNGYGNFVVLRHGDRYTTAYGHLSSFAAGLRQGSKISQGETIGRVGSTGWATGPHLHYELRINNIHQDPLTVRLPDAMPLSGSSLTRFRSQMEPLAASLTRIQAIQAAQLD
ncbi:M23 family metallopeptidase [Zoogloea dura]|uniref:Peptidoglycan DD-metalloendopeptidase family protein n=1 Tax=Zoogloea dura TaxID=2728840 RepID=A0A848GDK0_9RHOO|nr:peptidoglycan DD-metalloendopeptidase family protein [Zoogloea dura]NML28483.1 peptidoglycan DD-metalloendopeptidase family protein [Zoogloea dura]